MISLDLKPDLDNANVGKYKSLMGLYAAWHTVLFSILFSVNWGHHFSQYKKAPDHTDIAVYPGGIQKIIKTSADNRISADVF